MGSILAETKGALGLDPEAVGFDPELILHINSVLSDFNQLGIGPDAGYAITGADETWEDFLGTDPRYSAAKSLAFLQVKMLFDPPQVGYVLTAYEKLIEKAEWRLNNAREEIIHPPVVEAEVLDENVIILDPGEI